ncbi:hypothetical protein Poly21_06560 [Allorhodopirellula heiligendammensis]|uniref:Uncharacterized protein n=1 Tax=Allorhodopirellula heiligendammensis TaxID=2714739 RepID=A0A5C6C1P5_9BACT|nr:hypothetical protein Poly21_06560 [Allorhodopirellula heiligendammensis]
MFKRPVPSKRILDHEIHERHEKFGAVYFVSFVHFVVDSMHGTTARLPLLKVYNHVVYLYRRGLERFGVRDVQRARALKANLEPRKTRTTRKVSGGLFRVLRVFRG